MLVGIDIARQNEEVLTENGQTLNFIQADYRAFDFCQEMAYKILVNLCSPSLKFSFINLNYKQANFLANLYSY
ncbi:hypothetical protein [Campylobacter concisus]|uniref:hypothetical protein n=1 Tax=Campylobacter concisus TaxID=199 RepID=UPI00122CCB41|nr:hypothetical protein [Campylobacter concisus]